MKGTSSKYAVQIIKKAIRGELTTRQAAAKLNCTRQYVNKLKLKYGKAGKEAFVHGNKGKEKRWKLSDEIKEKIIQLYREKYIGFNFKHFLEKLNEVEQIKVTYRPLYRILEEANIPSPKRHKKRRKNNLHPSRSRRENYGELVQIDASWHRWFGEAFPKATMHGAIDDSTSSVLALWFEKEETLHGYYMILQQILLKHGIPETFYGDNRSIFEFRKLSEKGQTIDRDIHIQFKRCCQHLGIELITTSVSQAKGRIERLWGTLQSRLIAELMLNNINSIPEANAFLPSFIKDHNARFALSPDLEKSKFVEAPSPKEIDFYLSVKYERKIDHGSTFKFKNNRYQLVDDNGEIVKIPPKEIIDVYESFSNVILAKYQFKIFDVNITEVPINEPIFTKKPGRPKWKPGKNHPWRNYVINHD